MSDTGDGQKFWGDTKNQNFVEIESIKSRRTEGNV
jgi:hypothetical protein